MIDVSIQIRELINEIEPLLHQMSDEEVRVIPDQGGWSEKEIIGHLIDSATNNHHRIVRGVQNLAMAFPPYDQNR